MVAAHVLAETAKLKVLEKVTFLLAPFYTRPLID